MNFEQFLGWALVHSVWEVPVLAAGLCLFCRVARSANVRYSAAFCAMSLCLVAPAITTFEFQQGRPAEASLDEPAAVTKPSATPAPNREVAFGKTNPSPAVTAPEQLDEASSPGIGERIASATPGIARLWLLGVMVMALRLLGGIGLLRRVKKGAAPDSDGQWQEMADSLARRLGISGKVALRISDAVEVPTVIGIAKGIVLLPAGVILRMSPGQIEALLAHEIAHIRRHDLLANFVQSLLEVAMFFHPCAWWISSVIREEREHCCDDLAIQALGDRAKYARALVEMEGIRAGTPQLALSAKGGSLPDRISRIAKGRQGERFVAAPAWATLAVLVLICLTLVQSIYAARRAQPTGATQVIASQVVFFDNEKPAPGALVFCESSSFAHPEPTVQRGVAAGNGSFQFVVPAEDNYLITAYVKGKGIGKKFTGQPIQSPVRLLPVRDARVQVQDKAGKPIANVRVGPTIVTIPPLSPMFGSALDDMQSGVTDSKGWTTLHDLPLDEGIHLAVNDDRYATISGDVSGTAKTFLVTAEPAGTVTGTAMFEGKPAAGVYMIEFAQSDLSVPSPPGPLWQHARTDQNGHYELRRVPPGRGAVYANMFGGSPSPDDLIAAPVRFEVQPGRTVSVDIPLERCAAVQVKALDAHGNTLAQPTLIEFTSDPGPQLPWLGRPTKTPGTYQARLPAGHYKTTLLPVRRPASTESLTVAAGERKEIVIRESPEAAGLTDTSFRFLSPEGKSVSDAEVQYVLPQKPAVTTFTNSRGIATITVRDSDLGKIRLIAQKDDLFADVTPERNNYVIRMQRPHLGTVTGLIQDPSGRPVAGAEVIIGFEEDGHGRPAPFMGDSEKLMLQRTGPDGRYRFAGIYPGQHVLVMTRAAGLANGETRTVHIDGARTVVMPALKLAQPGVISGRIIDKDGTPIGNAYFGVLDATRFRGASPRTDAQGNFRQDRVPVGSHVVSISKGRRAIRLRAVTGSTKVYVADGKGFAKAR